MQFQVDTRLLGKYDIIVAGGGIAGSFAAASAAREGAKVLLVEAGGCLGGTLTQSSVPSIMDEVGKGGMLAELFAFLNERGMSVARFGKKMDEQGKKIPGRIVDVEGCKQFLEQLVLTSGAEILYYSRIAAVNKSSERGMTHIHDLLICTEAGNYSASADCYIDATGNGNLAALCGCGFECGDPTDGRINPASTGFTVVGFDAGYDGTDGAAQKRAYSDMLLEHGIKISAEEAGIVRLPAMKQWDVSIDYQYGVSPTDIRSMTEATINSRKEIFQAIETHKTIPGYEQLWLTHTGEHLGIREGRRVFGKYRITLDDILEGKRFEDGICLVRSKVDLHKTHSTDSLNSSRGVKSQPYEIPYRSLLPQGTDNLLLAGRCLSGDFLPHASYRMMGNMGATGEAAGFAAAYAMKHAVALDAIPCCVLRERMKDYL